jgi:hypothetical protein
MWLDGFCVGCRVARDACNRKTRDLVTMEDVS